MISPKLFALVISMALLLISLRLLSGIWLFVEKFGLTPSEVTLYFAGDAESFIMPKSFEGLLETAVPHFLAISTTIFVYAHFLLFTDVISRNKKFLLITSLFIAALIDIFSPLGIIYGYAFFAWAKVIAFWSFEFLMGLLIFVLFQALFYRSTEA